MSGILCAEPSRSNLGQFCPAMYVVRLEFNLPEPLFLLFRT